MSYQVTMKHIRENNYHVLPVGYCNMQFLLRYTDKHSYCSGVYGWNCDNYFVNGVMISTGYRPVGAVGFSKKDLPAIRAKIAAAEKVAQMYNETLSDYHTKKEAINETLWNLIDELKGGKLKCLECLK